MDNVFVTFTDVMTGLIRKGIGLKLQEQKLRDIVADHVYSINLPAAFACVTQIKILPAMNVTHLLGVIPRGTDFLFLRIVKEGKDLLNKI
jgi:hypothetical protein